MKNHVATQARNETIIINSGAGLEKSPAKLEFQLSQDTLQMIGDANSACTQVITADGILRFINPAGLNMLGFDNPVELLGTSVYSYIAPDSQADFRDLIQQVQQGQKGQVEVELVNYQGDRFWIETHAAPLYISESSEVSILAISVEIEKPPIAPKQQLIQSETEAQTCYSALNELVPVGIFCTGPDGECSYVNERWQQIAGLSHAEASGTGWLQGIHPVDRERVMQEWHHAYQAHQPFQLEYRFQRFTGETTWVYGQSVAETDASGNVLRYVGTITDISELKRAKEQLNNLNRVYATLNQINQAILHIRSPKVLLQEACRIAVEEGDFRMAWIGLIEQAKTLDIVAHAGWVDNYINNIKVELNDNLSPRGTVEQVLQQQQKAICNDIASEELLTPWYEDALRLGYRASAAFPLTVFGKIRGVLKLYASEPFFFNHAEVNLLDQLAMNVSFALEFIEQEEQRQIAAFERERLLAEAVAARLEATTTRELLESVFSRMSDGVVALNTEWQYTYISDRASELIGQPVAELLGQHLWAAFPAGAERFHQACTEALNQQTPLHIENYFEPWNRWFENWIYPSPDGLTIYFKEITARKQTEQALSQSEAMLRLFYDLPFIGMAITCPKTKRWVKFNDRLCEILGYPREELGQLTWAELTHPDDLPSNLSEFERVLQSQSDGYVMDKRFIHKDGQVIYARIDVKCIRSGSAVDFFIATVQDITESKQAEAKLRQSEVRYRELFETNPHPMWVYDLETLRFLAVNQAAIQHYGYSYQEFLGMTLKDIRPPEDIPALLSNIAQVTQGIDEAGEWRHLKKDGTLIRVEITSHTLHFDGRLAEVILVHDITERQKAEKQLRESEERFRKIVDTAHEGIWLLNAEGNTSYVNARIAEMLGYDPAEMIGKSLFNFMDDFARQSAEENLQRRRQGVREQHDFRFQRKDGSDLWTICSTNALLDEKGSYVGAVGMFTDITERIQSERNLKRYAERIQGLHDMDQAILAKLLPEDIAYSALSHLCHLLPCQQGLIVLFEQHTGMGRILAVDGQGELIFPEGSQLPITDFTSATLVGQPSARCISDIATIQQPSLMLQCLLAVGIRSVLVIPLLTEGVVVGELTLADIHTEECSWEHQEIAQEVANHLAIALQNAQLFERVRRDRERLQTLSSRLLEAQETERRHIAHELHDEIGQALTAVKINLQMLQRTISGNMTVSFLQDSIDVTDTALQQVRNLSLDLRPSMLDDMGLVSALRWYINRHAQRTGLIEDLICESLNTALPPKVETAFFRVVQEALTNIARHAQASQVVIKLQQHASEVLLTIQDNGVGFDVQAAKDRASRGASLGLLGMEERVFLIGGQLEIISVPNHGTEMQLHFPLLS